MDQLALQCFFELRKVKKESIVLLPEKCAHYIKNHVNQEINLTILTNVLNCSKSKLCALFKKRYATTVMQYINYQKVKAAKKMLTDCSINVNEVAYALSFKTPTYFMRVFKKYTDMTPSEYRKTFNETPKKISKQQS
nr:AraC family transcriptional regulator [Liquorilactobacillus oeni]